MTRDHTEMKTTDQRNTFTWTLSIYIFFSVAFFPSVSFGLFENTPSLTPDEKNNIEIFKNATHSVVYVTNTALKQDMFSFNVQQIPQGTGSGFVWDTSGIIVTNFHVIRGADIVTITLHDHSSWPAKVLGLAEDKDLAVLKIQAPKEKLKAMAIGDSHQLEVGRKVLAIGNPFGFDTTLTVGVVSALGREIQSLNGRTIKDVIQTDAAINPGNSGGPLLNSVGELVGVNAAIYSPNGASAGIGFAIPVNTVKKIVPQLIKYGKVNRPILGVETAPDKWSLAYGIRGVPLISVSQGLPAQAAGMVGIQRVFKGGLELGDVIIGINGKEVRNNDDLLSALEEHKAGDTINVTSQRGDEVLQFKVRLISQE